MGDVPGGGKITTATHPFVLCLREREQRTCSRAATSTLAVLHPCLCGCMKYSVWEEVGRWGREYICEAEVRYCLKLLMVKSASPPNVTVEGKLASISTLPLPNSRFHFCTTLYISLKSFHMCSGPFHSFARLDHSM